MKQGVNNRYRSAAAEFAERVSSLLGDQVHSNILYGSVARGRAKRDSDIDVLVIDTSPVARDKVFDIAYELGEATDFEIFITVVYFTREDLYRIYSLGSPFIANVVRDGIILHDDGTFAGLLKQVPSGR